MFSCFVLTAMFSRPQVSEYGVGARVIWAMSAGDREEAQAKKGEEGAGEHDSRAAAAMKQHWCVGLRILELVREPLYLTTVPTREPPLGISRNNWEDWVKVLGKQDSQGTAAMKQYWCVEQRILEMVRDPIKQWQF